MKLVSKCFALAALLIATISNPALAASDKLMMQLKDGVVEIQLRPDLAPNHVKQMVTLANVGFYDGIVFHRVISGFMAQSGDPTGTGTGRIGSA